MWNVKIAYLQAKCQFIIRLSKEILVILHPQMKICCIRWLQKASVIRRYASEGCDNQLIFNHNFFYIMYLDSAKKTEIFGQYGKSATDTGSAESQIALFTFRIKHLTEHLKENHKDYKTARSLTMLVGKRRALLDYLKDRDITRYRNIIKALGLRK